MILDRIMGRLKSVARRIVDRSRAALWSGRQLAKGSVKAALRSSGRIAIATAFAAFRLAQAFSHRDRVRSVLQVSVVSHKQFMLSRLLRTKGIRAKYYAMNTDISYLSIGYDYSLPYRISQTKRNILAWWHFWTVFARYDVIHYHFNSTLFWDGAELPYLKALGKVIVFHFRGCDLRQKSVNNAMNPELNCCQECNYPPGSCENDEQRRRLSLVREYGDVFFVTTPDLQDFFPEAEHLPFIPPYGFDLEAIVPADKPKGTFRVVTSSNHHGIDGTQYVRDAVDRLRSEGKDIELVEVHGIKYEQALALYKSGDVFLGKLRMGYYNNAVIECMMLGVPCMCYIRSKYEPAIPDSPIINTRPETAYENLKSFMERPDELRRLGALGPAFIKRHHAPEDLVIRMLDRYNAALKRKATGASRETTHGNK